MPTDSYPTLRQGDDHMPTRGEQYGVPRVPDDTIRELVSEGNTINQLARITGYSQPTLHKRLRRMRLTAKPCPPVSDEILIELADGSRTTREVIEATDGQYNAIIRQLRQLGLKTKRVSNNPRFRSEEGRKLSARIAQLRSEGNSLEAIGKTVGLSVASVDARYDFHKRNVPPSKG